MSDWGYINSPQVLEVAGSVSATSQGTAPATPGGNNAKGAWTQLLAATARHGCGLLVSVSGDAATVSGLLDIGIGGAGSEAVLVPDFHFQRLASSYGGPAPVFIPCDVPAGSRISCRYQGSATTATIRVSVQVLDAAQGSPQFGRRCAAYGVLSASSKGTQVVASASVNTKGSWVELVAATSMSSEWAVLSVLNDGASGKYNLIDLAVGAAGSEQIIIPDLFVPAAQTFQLTAGKISFPLHIPAGVRLAARAQSDVASAAFSVSLIVSG